MRVSIAKLTAVTAAALLVGGTSACSSGGDGDSSSEGNAITIWMDDNAVNPCFSEVVTSTFSGDIELDIELKKDWDSLTKTAVAGGGGPDIIMSPGTSYTAEYSKAGALAPLGDYSEEYGWADRFAPWAISGGEVDGELYSLQGELETVVLWYNKTLFEENGITPPETLDELDSVVSQFAELGTIPFAAGSSEWKGVNEWFASALMNGYAGADGMYSALSGESAFTDPEFVEAIETLNSWQQEGYVSGGLDRYYTMTFDQALEQFASGEAAMAIDGSWRFENIATFFDDAGNEWDWIPFPTADGEELYGIGTGSSWGINSVSENKDGAAEVLDHIFQPETQAQLAVDCGFAPGPVAIDPDLLSGLDERQARLYESVAEVTSSGGYGYLTWSYLGPKSDQYLIEELEKVWAGSMTVDEYLEGLQAEYQEELESGETPPLPAR